LLGVAFVLGNLLCDLPMFVAGPMQMPFATGIGYGMARANRRDAPTASA
jgi:hypothetical protein